MSSPNLSGDSSRSSTLPPDSTDLFQELWSQLRECHTNTIQELQAKVAKLKKERCLDAQKLEEFYNRNHLLKEQQKALQDDIKVLDERLRTGPCDKCTLTEKHMKRKQKEFDIIHQQNQLLISELKAERDSLQDQNNRLNLLLEHQQKCSSPQVASSEAEDGMIPDSPLQSVSLATAAAVSKMKRRKEPSHVRYSEKPLSQSSVAGGKTVLETCQLDLPDDDSQSVLSPVFEASAKRTTLPTHLEKLSNQTHSSAAPALSSFPLKVPRHSPPEPVKRKVAGDPSFGQEANEEGSEHRSPDERLEKRPRRAPWAQAPATASAGERPGEDEVFKHPGMQSLKKVQPAKQDKVKQAQVTPLLEPCASGGESPMQKAKEQSWSLDPAADLSQYIADSPSQLDTRPEPETVDTDCTYLSHSMLMQAREGLEKSGLSLKANDSLAEIFDKTLYGEYESCPQDDEYDEEDEEEEEGERDIDGGKERPTAELKDTVDGEKSCGPGKDMTAVAQRSPRRDGEPGYAYVDVVRNREERKKLKGHVCKECEMYYADLPEEEREKKLSACSRHRFRFIPPSTPEHFWEVGFPSTQTCVERGYIKEDKEPDLRLRRRRPYIATFSPKGKEVK